MIKVWQRRGISVANVENIVLISSTYTDKLALQLYVNLVGH